MPAMNSRVGFVINSRVPSLNSLAKGMPIYSLLTGWDDRSSPMSLMRFRWLADDLRSRGVADYRLFAPGKKFGAVVFLKSMTEECLQLATRLRGEGTKVVFDANVDYYTLGDAHNIPAEAVPSSGQREQAIAMTSFADSVMASSRHLAEVCSQYHPGAHWIPDNVNMRLVRPAVQPAAPGRTLSLWWSGMPQKVLDFLSIEDVLRKFRNRIHLHLVTGDFCKSLAGMPALTAARMVELFADVPHTFHKFRSIRHLLDLYTRGGGVVVSPRFLDNPYNLSHTEWKITLAMACGLPAIASPQPSYLDVAARCGDPGALRICQTGEEWSRSFEESLGDNNFDQKSSSAREVVRQHYSTGVVAAQHVEVLNRLLT